MLLTLFSKVRRHSQLILLADERAVHIPVHLCRHTPRLHLVRALVIIIMIPFLPLFRLTGLTCITTCSTSPSVYMVVNTMFGYNTAGRAGPSGTSVVFALDLNQVSTIVPNESATRQLTLNDLGTDCPQTAAASVIATSVPGGRCDPILAAPAPVRSWASPCNACGPFGMFDPPYAVPPLTGRLVPIPTTTTIAQPKPQTTTNVILATGTTTLVTTEVTSSDVAPTDSTIAPVTTEATSSDVPPTTTPAPSSSTSSATTSLSSSGSDPNPTTTLALSASATKVTGGLARLILCFFVSAYLV
jgi:hypothetical protein